MNSRSGAFGGGLAVLALVLTGVLFNVQTARSSDHQDSPTTVAHPAADITDVFVYPGGRQPRERRAADGSRSAAHARDGTAASLDPGVLYQFKIAHGASAGAEDMVIQLQATRRGHRRKRSTSTARSPRRRPARSRP